MTVDQKINGLGNGGRVVLSEIGSVRVAAERSGDGRTLRIVRETPNGFTVISRRTF